ncbi:hypothetical protein ACFSJ3_16935 [Corallincola platygyrae]|uniref:Uncharacterized protein n=1 Tax=Corallincola platygyrae TaxID=1193278 RepID=A0ABW4XQS3_9GAMM
MIKRFSTLETIRTLLAHPQVMLDCIQQMDKLGERFIRESQLLLRVRDYIANLDSDEQRRLQIAFSTDNLFHSQIIGDIEKVDGDKLLLFQDEVLSLFRLCDASLHQELTDSRLRSRLDSLRSVQERLSHASFIDSDDDFTELRDDLLEQLSGLLSLIRKHVAAMQDLSGRLESMSAEASRSPEHFVAFRRQLFERISHIYERHIKPTLMFVNPESRLADGANLFRVMKDCQQLLERHGKPDIADQVFRFSMSFTNVYKPVTAVSREVERFLRKTRVGMLESNAMEHFFQQLKTDYEHTLDHDLRKTRLTGTLAHDTGFALGLKQRARPARYRFGDSESYNDNLLQEIELRLGDLVRSTDWLPKAGEASKQSLAQQRMIRAEALFKWLQSLPLRPTSDMIAMLHERLKDHLPGYQLSDLLAASIRLGHLYAEPRKVPDAVNVKSNVKADKQESKKPVDDHHLQVAVTNKRTKLIWQDHAYIYRRRKLNAVHLHSEHPSFESNSETETSHSDD